MKNTVVKMNVQESKLRYDYSKLDEFLSVLDAKHLSKCCKSLVYAFSDLLAFAYNQKDDFLTGDQIQQEATDHIRYMGDLFQILEELPENTN